MADLQGWLSRINTGGGYKPQAQKRPPPPLPLAAPAPKPKVATPRVEAGSLSDWTKRLEPAAKKISLPPPPSSILAKPTPRDDYEYLFAPEDNWHWVTGAGEWLSE